MPHSLIPSRQFLRHACAKAAQNRALIRTGGVSSILLALIGLASIVWLCMERNAGQGAWAIQVLLAIASLLVLCFGTIRSHAHWTAPMRILQKQLASVQAGEMPIDQLSKIQGGLRAIVPAIQHLLRELRTQQAMVAVLEAEMHQKVANRTDALERTIGSLRAQATRDALTGLFNRRFLNQYLGQSVQRHLKEHKDLCLLMIDVDNFKILNDTLGHAIGDDLLKAIGQVIRSTIRGEDVGFRCGGDEFVVLLPFSPAEAGKVLSDRLIDVIDALSKTLKVVRTPRLSIGIATLAECKEFTPECLLATADKALYEVKKTRRSSREGLIEPAGTVQLPPLSKKAG